MSNSGTKFGSFLWPFTPWTDEKRLEIGEKTTRKGSENTVRIETTEARY
jgi:hypothetical protein